MLHPTYYLENVVKASDRLQDFEGPLDVILALLAKNKIEIRDIKISLILEQYLAFLDEMKSRDLDVASEFISMASYLVYLKTKELLDDGSDEELSEMEQFMLLLEKRRSEEQMALLRSVLPVLAEGVEAASDLFIHPGQLLAKDPSYRFIHSPRELIEAFASIASGDGAQKFAASAIAEIVPRKAFPVENKIDSLRTILKGGGRARLLDLFMSSGSRSETVAIFLAVLELCRRGEVRVHGHLEDCYLTGKS